MPQSATPYTSSFDLTFDQTFQGLIPSIPTLAPDPCRVPGVYLYWLSRYGWTGYLFRGMSEHTKDSQSVGNFQNGGLLRDTQRVTTSGRLVRAGSLTQDESEVVSSIIESIAVYALAPNKTKTRTIAVPVYVDPTKLTSWRDSAGRIGIEISYALPSTRSQRA